MIPVLLKPEINKHLPAILLRQRVSDKLLRFNAKVYICFINVCVL
jgi:hypothetical protein